MFNARWVDEQHKEKSRYVVKDFANTRDPTMFAAASDTSVERVVEFKAVLQNYSMFTFGVTSAYTHAGEDELVSSGTATGERSRNMVIACGGRSENVARVQDRGRSTLIPSSGARKHVNEVSQWNHIQSVRHSTTCVRQMRVIELHVH